jgi:hypothetical protein
LPMMGADIVAHEMDHPDMSINLAVQVFQKGDAFLLPFACITLPIDLAGAGIESCKEIEGPCTLILVLAPVRKILGLGGLGWVRAGPRLEGGLLIHGEDHFILPERARVEVNDVRYSGIEHGVPRLLGVEPEMMAPGLEFV